MNFINGVDISNDDNVVDFNQLKNQGIEIIYIQSTNGTNVFKFTKFNGEKESYVDSYYNAAKNLGFKIGFYHFGMFNEGTPEEQARLFYNTIKNYEYECYLMLDVEKLGGFPDDPSDTVGVEETRKWIKDFMNEFANLSTQKVGIYAQKSFVNDILNESFAQYPLWVASWYGQMRDKNGNITGNSKHLIKPAEFKSPGILNYWNSWAGWQWAVTVDTDLTSNGSIDSDVFNDSIFIDKDSIKKQTATTKFLVGEYVKFNKVAKRFAPDLIPESDKGKEFIIESINGDNILLKGLSEYVGSNNLESYSKPDNNGTGSIDGHPQKNGDYLLMPYVSRNGDILNVDGININLNTIDQVEASDYIYPAGFSQKLVEMVKNFEGFSSTVYPDSEGNPTIGYGHELQEGDGITSSTTLTRAEAEALLIKDLTTTAEGIKSEVAKVYPQFEFKYPCQLDAIINLGYNANYDAVISAEHNIFKACIENDFSGIRFDFVEWSHIKRDGIAYVLFGLLKRNLSNFIMFSTGLYVFLPGNTLQELEDALNFKTYYQDVIYH